MSLSKAFQFRFLKYTQLKMSTSKIMVQRSLSFMIKQLAKLWYRLKSFGGYGWYFKKLYFTSEAIIYHFQIVTHYIWIIVAAQLRGRGVYVSILEGNFRLLYSYGVLWALFINIMQASEISITILRSFGWIFTNRYVKYLTFVLLNQHIYLMSRYNIRLSKRV